MSDHTCRPTGGWDPLNSVDDPWNPWLHFRDDTVLADRAGHRPDLFGYRRTGGRPSIAIAAAAAVATVPSAGLIRVAGLGCNQGSIGTTLNLSNKGQSKFG